MPSDANRLKTSPWAFNEVSWLDILNGYRFRYLRLDIEPWQEILARQALDEIARQPRQGIPPRGFVPGAPAAQRQAFVRAGSPRHEILEPSSQ